MLQIGRYTNSGVDQPGDPFSSKPTIYAKDNEYGQRYGWVMDVKTRMEYIVHDLSYIPQPSTDTNVPELVRGVRRNNAGAWPVRDQLVVFELRDTSTTRRYPRSVSGWSRLEAYQAAYMQLIRLRCHHRHQPAVNRLVKLLIRQAKGEEVRSSQIEAQINELLKLGGNARFLLDLEALFMTPMTIEEINNPAAHTEAA